MAFGDGRASEEGLGPGVSDVLKSFKDKAAAKKPAPKPTPQKAPQFADAPYKMGQQSDTDVDKGVNA